MPSDPCKERHDLARKVSKAVEAIYKARRKYDEAKGRKSDDVWDLQTVLKTARAAERKAAEAWHTHVHSHKCSH